MEQGTNYSNQPQVTDKGGFLWGLLGCCITENVSYYTTGDKNTDVVEMDETTDKGNAKE